MIKVTYDENYLQHHGIKGQKWGDRNGPPYPLDADDHSSAEKKHLSRSEKKEEKAERKAVKQAFRSAGYSIAAKKFNDRETEMAVNKQNKEQAKKGYVKEKTRQLATQSIEDNNNMSRERDKRVNDYNKIASDYIAKYGDKKIKNLSTDKLGKIENASNYKTQKYLMKYTNSKLKTFGVIDGGAVGGAISGAATMNKYKKYKESLRN